ncbi:MAG TPA: hypothetical protein VJ837_02370, partial [Candidatus Paceibacterota bacterium]|nr:hypothetical protein [Candidatus Paceibacterota bacterium]
MRNYPQRKLRLSFLLMLTAVGCSSLFEPGAIVRSASGQQEAKVAPGSKVIVGNRFEFARVVVTGWDKDVVQAIATSGKSAALVPVQVTKDPSDATRILVTAAPGAIRGNTDEVRLEVRVPRHVEVEAIHISNAELEVTDIDGSVAVSSGSGGIIIKRVGSVKVRSGSGNLLVSNISGSVTVQKGSGTFTISEVGGTLTANFESGNARLANVDGSIDVTTSTGKVEIRSSARDVRVVSINGRTDIRCVTGRVEVRDTSGIITLAGISGDIDVTTSNGRAMFTGAVYAERRYRMKTLSGVVQMSVSDEIAGFTATLSS